MATRGLRHLIGLAAIAGVLRFVGCANGTDVPDPTDDGTGDDASAGDDATVDDASPGSDSSRPPADAGCPDGHTGARCDTCSTGFHKCGADCVSTQANFPEAGCATGCGTSCPSPDGGYATCSEAGTCDFACASGQVNDGGGCGCPVGQRVCADGACHQCCGDSDCPNHASCNTGTHTCNGCVATWGDCDGNSANGCETSLTSDGNCGQCGNSCCGSFCGCGFLGFGGESCNRSGTTYSCGC